MLPAERSAEMSVRDRRPSQVGRRSGPSVRTWLLAALELIGALALTRLIVWTDRSSPQQHEAGMESMPAPPRPELVWTWPVYTLSAAAAAAVTWWLFRRQAVAAIIGAAAIVVVVASAPARVLAAQSHLIAMVELEILIVFVPLLVLTVLPRLSEMSPPRGWAGGWTLLAVGSALLYSALLIGIHIPAVHHRGAEIGSVPLWVILAAPPIGIAYWFAVLRTNGRLPTKTRRGVLFGAQEVAALIGLLSLVGFSGAAVHHSPLLIPLAWDQRLGGLVMMLTCAAVAIPIARSLH